MSLLKIIGPDEAAGETEEIYQSFIDNVGAVPPPLLMASTSPGIQALQAQISTYYRDRSGLSPLLMSLIRYLTAVALEMVPCIEFNAKALTLHGMTDEQVAHLRVNPAAAPLDEKEGWLLAFVIKALRAPETLAEGHISKLRQLGWTDKDIFDALYISCMLTGMDRMMKALKFE
jgi:alkylhydroperoxidase family enzyme